VIQTMVDFSLQIGYDVKDLSFSPITGGEGNIEFLLHLFWNGEKPNGGGNLLKVTPAEVVKRAHEELKAKHDEV
jgi:23S rRNA (cytidine1920-2'-O)/16S rRNA (cytidine1409-2'-O)-methyltransferase